jgi:hypothetical protein
MSKQENWEDDELIFSVLKMRNFDSCLATWLTRFAGEGRRCSDADSCDCIECGHPIRIGPQLEAERES